MATKAAFELTMEGLDLIFASPELMLFMIVIADTEWDTGMPDDDDDDDDDDEEDIV